MAHPRLRSAAEGALYSPLVPEEALKFEYGIAYSRTPDSPHRTGLTEGEAVSWIDEWIEDGGNEGVFYMIRRPLVDWERYD